MRTIVYVDGFNLYYGALKGTPFKWLNLQELFRRVLAQDKHSLVAIKYFTARVQPNETDPDVNIRQDSYIQALAVAAPLVQVTFGHFLRHAVRMPAVTPPPKTHYVYKTEEKGSDVNLALHVLNDAWRDAYDCAVIVSNDSDLAESMCMVKLHHPHKVLGLITPGAPQRKTSQQLKQHADFQRPLRASALMASQLPASIELPSGGAVVRPATW